ncbi:MAG TPA: S-layer homology domain-containing protein, partial [Thermoanaerobaculia bacterium]
IESVLHAGIAAGCAAAAYCPGDPVTRSQMSLFLARGIAGGGSAIPASGSVGGSGYSCGAGGTSLFTDVLATDIFCRSVHYIAAQNVTVGCAATEYCPTPSVTRLEMSAFVARAVVAPGGGAAVPLTYGPDPVTNRSYSCDQASPNTFFTDVPASNTFCKHAHFLWAKNIIAGCGATTYCPNDPVTRDAMAKFLANGFQVQLYGP